MKEFWKLYLQEWHRMQMQSNGCMPTMMYGFIIASLVVCTLCGCKTTTSSEQTIDYRHMARLTERMDSLIHSTSTWQQSIYEKQTSLVDSFKHSEVRDTSHTIFLGAKGDTVKETIVIKEHIEREHTSSESTQELREEFLRKTDSILSVNKELSEKMDSVLHSHQKTAVVKEKPSLGDKIKWFAVGMILTVIGGISYATAFTKKSS